MSKVSIIVPVYNAEKTLERCLDSLVGQTYQNKEILLINDGSTDSSREICERYSHIWPCIILINQENAGPATARNTGIDRAQGQYIYFADADDYAEINLIELMVKAAEENRAEMVICGYYQETAGKSAEHRFRYKPGLYEKEGAYKIAVDLINDVSETRIPPYSWIRMMRRDVLENPKIRYYDGMMRSEDYYLYVQLHFRIKRLYLLVDKPLYHYVEAGGSITHRYVKNYWDSVRRIYSGLKKELPEQPKIHHRLNIMLVQRSLIALNNSARSLKKKAFKSELYEIVRDRILKAAIKQIDFKEGIKVFKLYYVLMRAQAYGIIYCRYLYKFYIK